MTSDRGKKFCESNDQKSKQRRLCILCISLQQNKNHKNEPKKKLIKGTRSSKLAWFSLWLLENETHSWFQSKEWRFEWIILPDRVIWRDHEEKYVHNLWPVICVCVWNSNSNSNTLSSIKFTHNINIWYLVFYHFWSTGNRSDLLFSKKVKTMNELIRLFRLNMIVKIHCRPFAYRTRCTVYSTTWYGSFNSLIITGNHVHY